MPRRRPGNQRPADIHRLEQVLRTAPGHVANVRQHVIDALTPQQVHQLAGIPDAILRRLDPDDTMAATYHRYDPDSPDVRQRAGRQPLA